MGTCGRDIAKVLAGFAANETLGHWWLGIWGAKLLPMNIGSFSFTPELNRMSMAFWPLALALCVYVGWRRQSLPSAPKPGEPRGSAGGALGGA